MTFFVCFITAAFFAIFGTLFYNELIYNDKVLFELEKEIKILKENIKCAKSDCACDRAAQFKGKLKNLEEDYLKKQKKYKKIVKKYKIQFALISPLASKIGVSRHGEDSFIFC